MIKANIDDKSLVADMLTATFLHNKSVNYLIAQDGLKMFLVHELIQYSFEICLLFGEVFICANRKGRVYYSTQNYSGKRLKTMHLTQNSPVSHITNVKIHCFYGRVKRTCK